MVERFNCQVKPQEGAGSGQCGGWPIGRAHDWKISPTAEAAKRERSNTSRREPMVHRSDVGTHRVWQTVTCRKKQQECKNPRRKCCRYALLGFFYVFLDTKVKRCLTNNNSSQESLKQVSRHAQKDPRRYRIIIYYHDSWLCLLQELTVPSHLPVLPHCCVGSVAIVYVNIPSTNFKLVTVCYCQCKIQVVLSWLNHSWL